METKTKLIVGGISVVIVILLIFTANSCNRIDAGHEGIKVNLYGTNRGVDDIAIVTGMVWYNPISERVVEYPIYVKTLDYDPFVVNAKDGTQFSVDPTISFNVIQGKSPHIYAKYRTDVETIGKGALLNYVKDSYRMQMNLFTTDEIISNRSQFETSAQNKLDSFMATDGFKLQQVTSGLTYPTMIVDAINRKNKAIQDAVTALNELEVTKNWAKKAVLEAETDQKMQELRQSTLTDKLLQKMFIDKWDGHAPLYGQSPTLFKNTQ